MEDVLSVYQRPLDQKRPLVCLDEASKQLLSDARPALAMGAGRPVRQDSEYVRNGTASLFMVSAPLLGWRHVEVTERRTCRDFAQVVKTLVDEQFAQAEKIVLVMDNLNTHTLASLYAAFPPAEAKRLADKLEVHHTPRHGSWLNMAEIELSVLARQCLAERMNDRAHLQEQVAAWQARRNTSGVGIDWRFTTDDARITTLMRQNLLKGQRLGRETITLGTVLLFLMVLYSLLPIILSGLKAYRQPLILGGFWSPDSGARFAMIRNWVWHGHLVYIDYAYAGIDPTGVVHPLAYYLYHQSHGFCSMYPPLFPCLCGLVFRVLGFHGLTLIPTLCGIGSIAVTYATARRLNLRLRLFLALLLGLATPLLLYSVVFWDHSAIILIAAMTGYWMLKALQTNSFRDSLITGAIIGLGIWLHELFFALCLATLLAGIPLAKSRPYLLGGIVLGFSSVLLIWSGFNWYLYGSFVSPHLAANIIQNNSDHRFNQTTLLNTTEFINRAMAQLVGTTISFTTLNLWPFFLMFACLLTAYVFIARDRDHVLLSSFIAWFATAIALWLVVQTFQHGSADGLFEATPLLIPALAVPFSESTHLRSMSGLPKRPIMAPVNSSIQLPQLLQSPSGMAVDSTSASYFTWLSRTCWLFIVLSIINPMYPGTDWGSRYLLSVLPLLALLATHTIEQQYQSVQGYGRICFSLTFAMIASISLICQLCSLSWVHQCFMYNEKLNTSLNTITSTMLVTDSDFNARLIPLPPYQARLLVRSEDGAKVFSKILRLTKVHDFVYVGSEYGIYNINRAIRFSGCPFVRSNNKLVEGNYDHKDIETFQVVHFALKTYPKTSRLGQL